jgi:F420 biosynthesis protein FbiB-like protein
MKRSHDAFWQTIFGRRSIRRYRPDPIPREMLDRVLTAAIWAPSAHNRQPWRFVVITRPEVKEALAEAMARPWREDMLRDGIPPEEMAARIQRSHDRLTQPPALILGCLTMADMDAYPDPERQQPERTMAIQSLTLALGNLMLAAHHEGLGSCWMCGPLFAPEEVSEALNLPADWEPQALISLGWPDEERKSERKPLEEVVVWE